MSERPGSSLEMAVRFCFAPKPITCPAGAVASASDGWGALAGGYSFESGAGAGANKYFRRSRTAMMLADDDRRYLAINHAACLLIGVEPSEIVGRRIDDLTPQEDKAQLPALWRRFLSEGMIEGTYELIRPGDGRRHG